MHLNNLVIYEVFIRNHSPKGDFNGLINDLDRIKNLGVDYIWLMPIHPIGLLNRKGTLGSPYSIADYLSINHEYGNENDFQKLVSEVHQNNMGLILDIVFNHTAHDSLLIRQHKEWFKLDPNGNPFSSVPEWTDIIELNYSKEELHNYLISVIKKWALSGVDGFRCDVASLIPVEFWIKAKRAAARINPDIFWIAESVHLDWIAERRKKGLFTLSDSELYQVFDITYDYDIFAVYENVLNGKLDVSFYLDMLRFQDAIYPDNYIKLRYVENHDTERIMTLASSKAQALSWTALQAFNKGAWLIYAGEESLCNHKPSHFEKDPIEWGNYELTDFIRNLSFMKKHRAIQEGKLYWKADHPAVVGTWFSEESSLVGLFNTRGLNGLTEINIPDAQYQDLISGYPLQVINGKIEIPEHAVIFQCELNKPPNERNTLLV